VLSKIVMRNYRTFRKCQIDFDPAMNILVGDNDSGKSTILEAVGLALTGRLHGKLLAQELSPHLFNSDTVSDYIAKLQSGEVVNPPEIIIDLFFDDDGELAGLRGTNNLLGTNEAGVRIRASLHPDYTPEYTEFVSDPSQVTLVPTEYYHVEWLSFAGNGITLRSVPATASLIDATTIRLQSGADYYLNGIITTSLEPKERVELARAYRSLRETFSGVPSITKINDKLRGTPGEVSDRDLTLAVDVSQKSNWENNLVPHLDNLPFQYVGKGEQNTLKILLALNKKVEDAHVVLVEEPENHLSFPNLTRLVKKINDKCAGKQVLITTHSSYVLNKLGLDNLVLLNQDGGVRLKDLPEGTQDYFRKLSGYDTLRVVLAQRSILVEGPSDELIVQRAYMDAHDGHLPIDDGIDVINVRGLSFKRFLDIAALLDRQVAVVTDNDGKDDTLVSDSYADYTTHPNITIHVGKNKAYKTLEPQILAANDRNTINTLLGKSYATDQELLDHMASNKTTCALAIFSSETTITMPEYIRDAVA